VTVLENFDNKAFAFGKKCFYLVEEAIHVELSEITKPANMFAVNGNLRHHSSAVSNARKFDHIFSIIIDHFLFKG
jgi:hypothetical protein